MGIINSLASGKGIIELGQPGPANGLVPDGTKPLPEPVLMCNQ